jgi:hypothetical protein
MIELDIAEVNATARRAARAAASRVPGSSVDDLAQSCWIWIMQNEDRIVSWRDDEDGGFGRLYKSLYHYCLDVAQRDRAERTGYKMSDNYYYSLHQLRALLPWWFEEDRSDPPAVIPDRDMKMDLDLAWKRLQEADRRLLARAFEGDPDPGQLYQALAVEYDCSDDAARKRVERSLRRLQQQIGGERPVHHERRKVMSNARARVEVSTAYDND